MTHKIGLRQYKQLHNDDDDDDDGQQSLGRLQLLSSDSSLLSMMEIMLMMMCDGVFVTIVFDSIVGVTHGQERRAGGRGFAFMTMMTTMIIMRTMVVVVIMMNLLEMEIPMMTR